MKVITLTKKRILSVFSCFLIGAIALTICSATANRVVETVNEERQIPIYYVDTDKKVCAISFDAAWGNEQTDTLLKILDDYDVKATFFLVGEWVEKYPDDVKNIAEHGHEIGNHSSTHAHMSQLSKEQQLSEIEDCNTKVKDLTEKSPTLFRAPYGEYNNLLVENVKSEDMYCVQWNIDSLDWKNPSADDMVKRIKSKLCPGSIILMHNGAENTPEALPKILEMIKSSGYEIVLISDMLISGAYDTNVDGKMVRASDNEA